MYHTITENQARLAEIRCFRDKLNRTIKPKITSPMFSPSPSTNEQIQQCVSLGTLKAKSSTTSPIQYPQTVVPLTTKSLQTCDKTSVEEASRNKKVNVIYDPYSCEFLSQLQGSYQTETCEINVVVSPVSRWQKQHAIVQRISSEDQSPLLNQFVYEEGSYFRLCSFDGQGIAVMEKGMNMLVSVVWSSKEKTIEWRRKGTVVFDLVNVVSLSQPLDQQQPENVSTLPTQMVLSSPECSSLDVRKHYNSESSEQSNLKKLTLVNVASGSSCTSEESYKRFITKSQEEEMLFSRIKKYFRVKPALVKKIVDWGVSEFPNLTAGEKTVEELSKGRIWVTVTLEKTEYNFNQQLKDNMDGLRGAYQELECGVYYQPRPEKNEIGVQHRLRRSVLNHWLIEEIDLKNDIWLPCAKELKDGKWVDLKSMRRTIKVRLVPVSEVLQKIGSLQDLTHMEKYLDFLFTACNQRKLVNKLKIRNLKHNIANLKLKLQKQYALNFAIKVALTADSIALELEDY